MIGVAQLIPLLPENYTQKLLDTGAIKRWRGIKTPEDLMHLSLFHLVNGCSLVEVSQIADSAHIAKISDVAFMERFALCGDWFKAISEEIAPSLVTNYEKPNFLDNYRVVATDASDVIEKGRSGSTYRLHYAINIFTMNTVSYKITKQEIGEKLSNFTLSKGDLVLGDRAYGTINSMTYALENNADYLLRLRLGAFKVYDEFDAEIDILDRFKHLDYEQEIDFHAFVHTPSGVKEPIRICVRKKDIVACQKARKRVRRRASRKQQKLGKNTETFNEFIVLATSLPDEIACSDILKTYRYRWQVENYFKRLKSIMDFGDLPKKREQSSLAWLNGKLMVALLMEQLIAKSVFPPAL